MPNTTLRSAIVGVGQARGKGSPTTGSFRIGYVHAQMYGRTPGYELAAAADINPGNLAAFQEQFAVPGYGGIDEMLAAARPDVIEWRKKQVVETDGDVFLNVFDIYAETEMGPWLHEVTAPSLVLTGELDGGCNPRLNRQIAEALPNSELVILDGLKHAILIEASDRVGPPVKAFLRKHA